MGTSTSVHYLNQSPQPSGLSKFEIDYRELIDLAPLDKGSFGTVSSAKWRKLRVAVKQLSELNDPKQIEEFRAEGELLCSLRPHPNVVLFLGITHAPQPTTIITEYCMNGSLFKLLQ